MINTSEIITFTFVPGCSQELYVSLLDICYFSHFILHKCHFSSRFLRCMKVIFLSSKSTLVVLVVAPDSPINFFYCWICIHCCISLLVLLALFYPYLASLFLCVYCIVYREYTGVLLVVLTAYLKRSFPSYVIVQFVHLGIAKIFVTDLWVLASDVKVHFRHPGFQVSYIR